MTMKRTHTVAVQGQETRIKLSELRWLVEQLKEADGNMDVNVHSYVGDQRDPGYTTLSADVPDAPAKPKVNHR